MCVFRNFDSDVRKGKLKIMNRNIVTIDLAFQPQLQKWANVTGSSDGHRIVFLRPKHYLRAPSEGTQDTLFGILCTEIEIVFSEHGTVSQSGCLPDFE